MNTEIKQIAIEAHQQWLQHPTTRTLMQLFDEHEKDILNHALHNSGSVSANPVEFQLRLVEINTTRALKKLVGTTELFVNKTIK